MDDLISRQAALDEVDSETVSTNPEHFKSSEKFIKFMNDADISSFGKWQWANGFNTALVATTIQLKKLPSVQPEERTEKRMEMHACDLISRRAALDALDKRFDNIPMENTTEILMLRKDLRELPAVQAELIDGKWVLIANL